MQTRITATAELNNALSFAYRVGCYPDQVQRFLEYGYVPQARQMEFHAAARECNLPDGPDRVGYGGTRGQAKSHAILAQVGMDDCQRYPGLKWLYLRNIGKAATEQFEDLVQKLFSHVAREYKSSHGMGTLYFPNGSRIVLGGFRSEAEIDGYLGIEYDGIVLEDATTLTESKYNTIQGSLRTSKPDWRPRLYASANPGGVGHGWFKRIFVDPRTHRQEQYTRFIHTVMGDNIFIDEGYARYLDNLTGWLRRAWRDGDFTISAGQFFTTFDPDVHVKAFDILPGWTFWGSHDYGVSHWNVMYLLAQDGDGHRYMVDEHARRQWLVKQHAGAYLALLGRHNLNVNDLNIIVAGHDVFIKRDKGQEIKSVADEYEELGLKLEPAQTDRINGAAKFLSLLGSQGDGIPHRLTIHPRCAGLVETLPMLQHDPRRQGDVLKVDCNPETGEGGDDFYDAARYGLMVDFAHKPAGETVTIDDANYYKTGRKGRLFG